MTASQPDRLTDVFMPSRILHSAGERLGRCSVRDSLTTPIVQTATYFFKDTAELIAFQVISGIQ